MKRARLLPIAAVVLGACQAILGIDDRPLRGEPDASGDDASADAPADVAPPCVDEALKGCASCPHTFCADFDRADAFVPGDWTSVVAPAGGSFAHSTRGDGAAIELIGNAVSAPHALRASIVESKDDAFVFVSRSEKYGGDPASFEGVRLRYLARPLRVEVQDKAGPLPDAGFTFSGAILREPETPLLRGAMIALSFEGVHVVASGRDLLDPDKDGGAVVATVLAMTDVTKAPFTEIELTVTTRARALRDGLAPCEATAGPVVIAARAAATIACVDPPAELANLDWARTPLVFLGAATFGPARVDIAYDNVRIDFLER